MTAIPACVARYAQRMHASAGDGHHVASPLGAWLLLALAAPAATGAARTDLTEVLGTDAETAADAARTLLAAVHPLVGVATGLWQGEGVDAPGLAAWRAGLPPSTGTGPVPDQAALDSWAREHTLGLIDEFPLDVRSGVLLVLASALATRVSWAEPFEVTDAGALGPGNVWAGRLRRVLRTPRHGHRAWIAATDRTGDVIAHAAPARPTETDGPGLLVVSVAAAPDVASADVLATAHGVAAGVLDGGEPVGRRSLYDLPLGDTALWTLREETVRTFAGREEHVDAVLPCWSAGSRHDLTAPTLGFRPAADAVGVLLERPGLRFEAAQSASARFGRFGFEAAAVTGFAVLTALPPEGLRRSAELRFGHPYAVVAVATDDRSGVPGPWHGLPVFSAWVAEPEELPEADAVDPPEAW
ncbi:hypothetical protein QTQ03_03795 [Micromonospora sp. WMMA1363]|uniref:hypothetical protein n=1 Tax=Micromonospora sp. WMMA1363 TaxID=3053985 RepID=UPI00259D2F8E|nr:hypothetical protein [Micromonospora sp. WMMA1363]MDM4718759.1 hypothetical protein [Micromonospora sp. WMMA1363]